MVSKAFGLSQLGDTDSIRVDGANNILQVTGSVRVTENVAFDSVNAVRLSEPEANTLTIHTAGSERLRITSNGLITSPISGLQIISGTSVSSNTGTSIDFTGIPSWVKRITVMFNGVSTNGTSTIRLQLGDSGGVETTGYAGTCTQIGSTVSSVFTTSGFDSTGDTSASQTRNGQLVFALLGSNTWTLLGAYNIGSAFQYLFCGTKTLSDTLTQVRITTVNGTDTFDAGTINILYE